MNKLESEDIEQEDKRFILLELLSFNVKLKGRIITVALTCKCN